MPLKLTAPIYTTSELTKSDEKYGKSEDKDPTWVTVKQASQGEHEQRQALFATLEQKWSQLDPDEVSLVQTVSMEEVKKLEVYLTLCESNFLDEADKPLFPTRQKDGNPQLAMPKAQFVKAWARLLPDVAREIHEIVLEANPLWGSRPAGEAL